MTTIKAGTTSTTGFVVDTDASGTLILQSGGSNNAVIIDSQTQQATFTQAISQPGAFMFRNRIINGNFDIWQRGTSQTSSGFGSADRWLCYNSGSTKTASRQAFALGQTEVPGNPSFFMRHVVSSVAGAGNNAGLYQPIEYVSTFAGQTVTVSFWARADSPRNIALELEQFFGTGGTPSSSVNIIGSQLISLTATWSKYTATINVPSIAEKTLGTDSNDTIRLIFWFDAGSNFNARTANLGQQSGTFDLAQVQLEEGAVATPFEQRPFGMELSLCQRYYQNIGSTFSGVTNGTTTYEITIPYLTNLRASPQISVRSGGIFSARRAGGDVNITNPTIQNTSAGLTGGVWTQVVSSGLTTGQFVSGRMQNITVNDFLACSAEL
jgi:hypothetical protein